MPLSDTAPDAVPHHPHSGFPESRNPIDVDQYEDKHPCDESTETACTNQEEERVGAWELFKFAERRDHVLMVVGTIAAIVGGCGLPAFSFAVGNLMNGLLSSDPEEQTAKAALIMVYIGIGESIACMIHVGCWCIAALRQVTRLRAAYFAAVMRQEIGWHDAHKPGALTARMTGDTRVVQNGINDRFSQGVLNFSMGFFGFIFGFVFCWELALVMLGMMPFVALCGALTASVLSAATSESRKQFAHAGSIATEVIENIRTVQVFGKEAHETARFSEAIKRSTAPGLKRELMNCLSVGATLGLVVLTYTVVFIFSSYLIIWGRTNIGDIVATFLSVLMGSLGLGYLFPSLSAFTEARVAAVHLYRTIERRPLIDVEATGINVTGFREAMEFRHVQFAYPTRPDMVLFRDLCLTIKCGQKVAFSGASGCGKSSMIGLIQRFYDPIGGEVLCDGVDMRELNLREWRDQIGIVSQEPNLFAGTMIENVRVGKEDATEEEVIEACKQANIHDTIMTLPEQYNTPVGSVGSQLSGGQKQRIAIARALVKRPAILLLDEATSALDRKSEMEVQAALDALMASTNMTVVVIAHRLATIRHVDCIYYIAHDGEKGSYIEEEGTFDVLMQRGGAFAAMAKSQGVMPRVASNLSESSCGEDGGGARTRGRGYTQILGEAELAQLDREKPRTERQMIALDKLAAWEIGSTHVSPWRLLLLNRSYAWALVLALFGSIIAGAIAPVNTILLGKLMNALAEYKFTHDEDALHRTVNRYAPAFVGIAAAALGGWLLQFFYGYAGEHLTTRLRTWLFQQILRQDMSFFDTPNRDAGVLSGMLSGDCEAIQQLCGAAIGIRIQSACTIAVGVLIAFLYQWKIALVSLGCVPLIVIASLMQQLMLIGANRYEEGSSDDTVATEALSNVRTIASFNLQLNRLARFSESMERENPSTIRRNVLVGIIYGASQFVYYGAFALCYWYGGKLITQGEADFESVNVASLAILMGATSAGEAGGFAAKLGDAKSAVKRVFSIIDRVPDVDIQDPARTQVVPLRTTDYPLGCQVDVQRTHFIYPARPNQVVLQSLDLHIPPGSTVGMTGQTGCGKSTLIQLLSCFYAARRGDVLLNGTSISALSIGLWRQHISVVLQEPDLFSGTVRDNITYALTEDELANTTQQDVERVATWACIHDDVMAMPEGYDTDVGYKGRSLSGGQKQRVAIARGLLRPGVSLLLLDEATSALDNATEARVQRGIEAYMDVQNQAQTPVTVMSIAHRLTTIRYFDQIVLMDAGRIVEQGTHEELMKLGGEYQTRWELFAAGISV